MTADPTCIADAALAKILRDLRGRKGIGDEWAEIDVDIRNEIIERWRGFIVAAVENPLG